MRRSLQSEKTHHRDGGSQIAVARKLPIFASLRPGAAHGSLRELSIERVPARAVLFKEGQIADSLCVLIEDLIQLFTVHEGRERTVLILSPHRCFGTEAVLGDSPLLASVRALRPSCIGRITASAARHLFGSNIKFANAIARDLDSTYHDAVRELMICA